jgi:hypothetical protein
MRLAPNNINNNTNGKRLRFSSMPTSDELDAMARASSRVATKKLMKYLAPTTPGKRLRKAKQTQEAPRKRFKTS